MRHHPEALQHVDDLPGRERLGRSASPAVPGTAVLEEERAEDPRDIYSVARVLERARQDQRCESEYRRAVAVADGPTTTVRIDLTKPEASFTTGAVALTLEGELRGRASDNLSGVGVIRVVFEDVRGKRTTLLARWWLSRKKTASH